MPYQGTQVVKLVKEWNLTPFSPSGQYGVRKYVDADSTHASSEYIGELPSDGDKWSAEYPLLRARSMQISYAGENDSCGRIYTVQYDSIPRETNQRTSGEEVVDQLPASLSVSSSYTSDPSEGLYAWDSTSGPVVPSTVRISRRCFEEVLTLSRYVYDDDLAAWNIACCTLVQRVNANAWNGYPAGTVLFAGATGTEEVNPKGNGTTKRWAMQLTFICRAVSWQKQFDPATRTYRDPVLIADGSKVYEEGDFNLLLTASAGGASFPELINSTADERTLLGERINLGGQITLGAPITL